MLCVHVYVTQHMGENDIYRAECKYYALRRSMVEFKTEMEKKKTEADFSSQPFHSGNFLEPHFDFYLLTLGPRIVKEILDK